MYLMEQGSWWTLPLTSSIFNPSSSSSFTLRFISVSNISISISILPLLLHFHFSSSALSLFSRAIPFFTLVTQARLPLTLFSLHNNMLPIKCYLILTQLFRSFFLVSLFEILLSRFFLMGNKYIFLVKYLGGWILKIKSKK